MLRRCLLLLCFVATGAAVSDELPKRNLVVSWRWTEAVDRSAAEAALRGGGVVVGTGGSVDARGTLLLRSGSDQAAARGEQRVMVLNGSRASLGLTQLVPLQWVEVAVGAKGPVGALRQQWVEAGSRLEVRPRWLGGRAPVELEVVQQASSLGDEAAASGETTVTTLQLPLDEWVTVAQAGTSRQAHEAGVLSSRDAQRHAQRLLQMRVSAP